MNFQVNLLYIYIYIYILLLASFSHRRKLIIFHWSLSNCKSPQVSRILLSIQADLNNAYFQWSPLVPLSTSCNPLIKLLGIILSAPITIGIIVTFMFHSFFSSLARSTYLSQFIFFDFNSVFLQDYLAGPRFLFFITGSGFLSEIS